MRDSVLKTCQETVVQIFFGKTDLKNVRRRNEKHIFSSVASLNPFRFSHFPLYFISCCQYPLELS